MKRYSDSKPISSIIRREEKTDPKPEYQRGGNSAVFLRKMEAKPAALLVESRTRQKSFLFLLPARRSLGAGGEEKIRRTQIRKNEENFFAGWRVVASGGGVPARQSFSVGGASLVWFRSGVSDKMSSSQTVKTHQNRTQRLFDGLAEVLTKNRWS